MAQGIQQNLPTEIADHIGIADTLAARVWLCLCAAAAVWTVYAESLTGAAYLDFGCLWESGHAWWQGTNPYAAYAHTTVTTVGGITTVDVNLKPPVSLFLLALLATLDIDTAWAVWTGVEAAVLALSIALLARAYPKTPPGLSLAFVVLLPALSHSLILANIYGVLALTSTLAWLSLRRGAHLTAGLLIGLLAAVKPLLLVWPALLLFAGHWRAGGTAIATIAVASLAAGATFGFDTFGQWIAVITAQQDRYGLFQNISLFGVFTKLGTPSAAYGASLTVLAGAALYAVLKRPDPLTVSTIALLAALLASPLSWFCYLVFALPLLFAYPWTPITRAGIFVLSVPYAALFAIFDSGPAWLHLVAHIWSLGMLLLAWGVLRKADILTAGPPYRWLSARNVPIRSSARSIFSSLFAQDSRM